MIACSRTDPHTCRIGAHLPQPLCAHCGAPDVVRGDGEMALVCPRCIAALGRVAGDPATAHPEVVARLQERSLDVVHLDTRIAIDPTAPWAAPTVSPRWHWASTWPKAGDGSLINGRERA
jgi:hypothetical protein